MSNFLDTEIEHWGKIYTDISFAIDDISGLLTEKELRHKKFYKRITILDEYIKKIKSEKLKPQKRSFFSSNDDSYPELEKYKAENIEVFKQLENCSKCQCLSCTNNCEFSSCQGCRSGSFIKDCDKDEINVTKHQNYRLNLTNNDTGKSSTYKVLATLQNCKTQQWYIVLENVLDIEDKYVLYYNPGIKEDTYDEITNPEEFDFVVEAFENSNF